MSTRLKVAIALFLGFALLLGFGPRLVHAEDDVEVISNLDRDFNFVITTYMHQYIASMCIHHDGVETVGMELRGVVYVLCEDQTKFDSKCPTGCKLQDKSDTSS